MHEKEPEAAQDPLQPAPDEAPEPIGEGFVSNGAKAIVVEKGRISGALADPEARKRLEKAASHVGLTLEEMANLMVDSGITALPPSDGITGTYTLKDLGVTLWNSMQKERPSARSDWFHNLAPTQQKAVVVTLRDRGFSSQAIANDFKIGIMSVNKLWNQYADDLGAQVVGLRLNTIAGNLQIRAERAIQGAMEEGKWSIVWKIEKELTEMFQKIGIVDRAIHKVEVTHKMEHEKSAELQALLDLERKKQQHFEDVKIIEVEVQDPIPEVSEDYDD